METITVPLSWAATKSKWNKDELYLAHGKSLRNVSYSAEHSQTDFTALKGIWFCTQIWMYCTHPFYRRYLGLVNKNICKYITRDGYVDPQDRAASEA